MKDTPVFEAGLRALPRHTQFLVEKLPFPHKTRMMDVGANPANVPAYAPLRDAGVIDVHGFEPGEDSYVRLIKAAKPNEHYHPYAIGLGSEETFYATTNGSFASLFNPSKTHIDTLGHWHNALTVEAEIPVVTRALDALDDVPRPDMLKMDTQGAELMILEGGQDKLSEAVVIMPELRYFQLYENEPMFGVVDTKLREMGFMLHKVLPGATLRLTSSRIARLRPVMVRNQMVDADFIYIRDLAHADKMSDGQLAHLALLADSVFTSMDVVLRRLDLLVARSAFEDKDIDAYIYALPPNFSARPAP